MTDATLMVGDASGRFHRPAGATDTVKDGGGMALGYGLLGTLALLNFNSTADQPITIASSLYLIDTIIVYGVSTSLGASLAAGGLYTAASKAGTAIVAAGQLYTALTGSTVPLALTIASSLVRTETTLYLSLTVAHGSAATGKLAISGWKLG